jgi:hypothetical protein
MNCSPIFIGGINRSGTSLVRAILSKHSALAVPPAELSFFRVLDLEYERRFSKEELQEAATKLLASKKAHLLHVNEDKVLEILAERLGSSNTGSLGIVFDAVMSAYAVDRSKDWWVEKTTYYEFYYDVLKEWFPNLKFIHMVRHPINVYASWKNYRGKRHYLNIYRVSKDWKRSAELALARKGEDRYLVVRYEDLVIDPESRVKEICNHLNLEFGESLLNSLRFSDSSFQNQNKRKDIEKENGIYKEGLNRSRYLKDYERRIIYNICGEAACKLGYCDSEIFNPMSSSTIISSALFLIDCGLGKLKNRFI